MNSKNDIRKYIAEKKKEISQKEIDAFSTVIFNKIETLPEFASAKQILIYHSIEGEVQTGDFIEKYNLQKDILLPVVKGNDLVIRKYIDKTKCLKGPFDILEPIGDDISDNQSIDLIIIPGTAFDKHGNRMGRGKGFYDRLLASISPKTVKIGICFDFQLLDTIPVDNWDIKMDIIISPKELIINK